LSSLNGGHREGVLIAAAGLLAGFVAREAQRKFLPRMSRELYRSFIPQ
jgi:hypothetical protein